MDSDQFSPGDSIPVGGVYWVQHHKHREPHLSALKAGERLPECHKCHQHVRFHRVPGSVITGPSDLFYDVDFVAVITKEGNS